MDDYRILVAEFSDADFTSSNAGSAWGLLTSNQTDTRSLDYLGLLGVFVQESTIDLSGYQHDDKTLFFRNAYTQRSDGSYISWITPSTSPGYNGELILETTFCTTVPFTDEQIAAILANSPGFDVQGFPGFPAGTERTQVIHGERLIWGASSLLGSTAFTTPGNGYMQIVSDTPFSSLEPTANDTIYCYRMFALPFAGSPRQLSQIWMPALRVVFNCYVDEEPTLEYMMRLRRSYELAATRAKLGEGFEPKRK